MNKQILEYTEQARLHAKSVFPNSIDDPTGWNYEYHKKFAQLIVAECLGVVKSSIYGANGEYDYSYSDEDAAADERAESIYKDISYHFGVEE